MDSGILKAIITQILCKMSAYSLCTLHPTPISVGVSNRHVHLSQEDAEAIFGKGYNLNCVKDLSQPGQCATSETVIIAGPKGCIEQVRVLGPVRKQTQVEIMRSDTYKLGVNTHIRESGQLEGTESITIIGPLGSIKIKSGLIIAKRHIHMTPKDAAYYNVNDSQVVQVKAGGERGLVFDNVVVRVSEKFALDFHIDVDEGNCAGIKTGDKVFLLTQNFSNGSVFESNKQNVEEVLQRNEKDALVLVTEDIVREAWKKERVIFAKKSSIITPLAKDTLNELGVKLEYV